MKKLILFVMGAVCVLSPCKGQHPSQNAAIDIPHSKIAALKIGDKVPDVVFRHMLNYKDSTARLSDFKGKPIILDFFATWCGSCIWALPKLYNLQTQFKEEFHILVVDNYDTPAKLKHFIKENPTGESIKLPFIVRDSILNRYFPYRFIPHEVWIDAFQRVVAITTSKYVNESNLKRLISGQKLNLPIKKDVKAKFDRNKPLLDDGNGGDINKLLFRSSLTEHLPGVFVGGEKL